MISELAGVEQAVVLTFILTFFGTAAAAVLFFVERDKVAPQFRSPVLLSGLICAIAAGSYFFMRGIYVEGVAAGTEAFPTEFRYVDWLLTVPLMLAKFPSLLGLGRRGAGFMAWLLSLSVVMVVAGYVGEVNQDEPLVHLGMWALGCLAWVGIAIPLLVTLRDVPARVPPVVATTVRIMGVLVLVGWLVYPLGYLQPTLGLPADARELVYNLADLVNKVGLGAVVYLGGRAALTAPATPPPARPVVPERPRPESVADALLSRSR